MAFTIVKLVNYKLHHMYDTGEMEEVESHADKGSKTGSVDLGKSIEIKYVHWTFLCYHTVHNSSKLIKTSSTYRPFIPTMR